MLTVQKQTNQATIRVLSRVSQALKMRGLKRPSTFMLNQSTTKESEMSDKLPVVQAIHQRSDMVTAVQAFHEIVNKVISQAIRNGTHSNERVLLLLTETDSNSGYGYDENDSSYPHSTDGQLIMPFGKNELGQRQFLISFNPASSDDKSHPDPSVPPGWDWKIYSPQEVEQSELEQTEQPQIVILLTRPRQMELDSLANSGKGEISGFSLVKMPDLEKFEQFAIVVDQSVFTVQIRTT